MMQSRRFDPVRPRHCHASRTPMYVALVILAVVLTWTVQPVSARDASNIERLDQWPVVGEVPAAGGARAHARALGDTLFYGYYNGSTGLAIEGYPRGGSAHTWTFDHGASDPFEGWYATDLTENPFVAFRQITAASWAGHDNAVSVPILAGAGSAWIGNFEDEADDLCWTAGLGYGNSWCQQLTSPSIAYTSGGATLSFDYFNDTENGFDYTKVILLRPNGDEVSLNFDGFTHQIGLATDHPTSIPDGTNFASPVSDGAVGGFASFQLVFEMESDGGWSDEDGAYATEYGPFAVDNLTLAGGATASYTFDASLEGWTPSACAGVGTFFGVRDVNLYVIQDPCVCELSGNVLEFHQDDFDHQPYGQRVHARSNPVDLANAQATFGSIVVGAYWDQYSELPVANGVFYRPSWTYFPYLCAETGNISWSPRIGQGSFNFVGEDPVCTTILNNATNNGIPADADQVRFLYEVYASCDAFGIAPTDCANNTNFTPIIDNINVFATENADAPTLTIENGFQHQDGFSQSFTLSPFEPGRADCTINENFGNTPPFVLENAISVTGPVGTARPYSVKQHFRIVREGPGAGHANFADWQAWKTLHGLTPGGSSSFASALMDTFEVAGAPIPTLKRFDGYYREDDPNNPSPGTELVDANVIIVDNVPPGTKIEYFISAKFDDGVDQSTLPDTTGGHFAEFEILPSWRPDFGATGRGVDKFPSVLYLLVEAANPRLSPSQRRALIEEALEILYGPPSIAQDRDEVSLDALAHDLRGWDRYDYLDGTSNWKAPFARGVVGANNGVPLPQLLGYRAILTDSGSLESFGWPEDWALMSDWLTAVACDGNVNVQGLMMNGDNMGNTLRDSGPGLLNSHLGAGVVATAYNEDTSGGPADENFCVNLDAPGTALYGTSNTASGSYTYDAWGNWCPNQFAFDVLETQSSGVGNRVYTNIATLDETQYAQVANEVVGGGTSNYRTVIDGVAWVHTSARSGTIGDPQLECSSDSSSVVTAIFNEILAGLEWVFGGSIPSLQFDPCGVVGVDGGPDGAPDFRGSRLAGNTPNPFNPRTVVRFNLATEGQAQLRVYDTAGRLVRTLVDEALTVGPHRAVWDGRDDHGRRLPAGVYWSQLSAPDGYTSSKRMVIIR